MLWASLAVSPYESPLVTECNVCCLGTIITEAETFLLTSCSSPSSWILIQPFLWWSPGSLCTFTSLKCFVNHFDYRLFSTIVLYATDCVVSYMYLVVDTYSQLTISKCRDKTFYIIIGKDWDMCFHLLQYAIFIPKLSFTLLCIALPHFATL